MSTRKKRNKKHNPHRPGSGHVFLSMFLTRQQDMSEVHDNIMLTMRLAREALVSRDGTTDTWVELAGLVNVCGLYANAQGRADWYAVLQEGANGLRSIEQRVRRVGGRYTATEQEAEGITAALNVIDYQIIPTMPLLEFCRYADVVNKMAATAPEPEEERLAA